MCQLATREGGVMIREFCFAYENEEQWSATLEALTSRFGSEYFESYDFEEVVL